MGQVIEVRLINPGNGEVMADEYTSTSSKNFSQTSHTAMHREAIELALKAWSGGRATLKDIQRSETINGIQSGPAWQYGYGCTITDKEDEYSLWAILFAQYKEKEKEDEA